MKTFKRIIYFILTVIVYCLITVIDYFLGNYLLEIFTFDYLIKLLMVLIELLIVNPILTYFVMEKLLGNKKQEEPKSVFLDE